MRPSTIVVGDYSIRATHGWAMPEVTVRSELNAVVWKIESAAGVAVDEGANIIILEAMKMEIPVTSPRSGRVKTILVTEKQQVAEGQPVAILEF
jgi:biotin carboxyl carrier protein